MKCNRYIPSSKSCLGTLCASNDTNGSLFHYLFYFLLFVNYVALLAVSLYQFPLADIMFFLGSCAFDAEIIKYVSEAYPKGICCVYCTNGKDMEGPGSSFEFVVVISAARLSPQNFWYVKTCQVLLPSNILYSNLLFLVDHLLVAVLHHIMHVASFPLQFIYVQRPSMHFFWP